MDTPPVSFWLPRELWLAIFQHLTKPSDRLHISLCCRNFYSLMTPLLLTNIRWDRLATTLQNLSFWKNHPQDFHVPQELAISVFWLGPILHPLGNTATWASIIGKPPLCLTFFRRNSQNCVPEQRVERPCMEKLFNASATSHPSNTSRCPTQTSPP